MRLFLVLAAALGVAACADQTVDHNPTAPPSATPDPVEQPEADAAAPDAAVADARPVVDASPPVTPPACTSTFGTGITPAFGRLDGTVRIVITPGLPKCKSDDDHVIVQIDVIEGGATKTYPVLVNILSDIAVTDPAVRLAQTTHALVGPAWASGWHTTFDVGLDYPSSLGVHTGTFTAKTKAELATAIAAALPAGAKVSAYMSGFDTMDGGHKVHRNFAGQDGALAVVGAGTPTWLLFQFSQQVF